MTDSTVDVNDTSTTENEAGSLAPDEGGQDGFNPAWNPLLEVLPDGIKPLVKEPLKQWDKNYQELQDKYKPFADLPEQYRNADTVQKAMQVWGNLETNPQGVLKLLAESLGVSLAEAKEIVKEEQKAEEKSNVPLEFSEDDDPRLKTMADQLTAYEKKFNDFFTQQTEKEQQALVAKAAAEEGKKIDAQVEKILQTGEFGTTFEEQKPFLQVLMPLANTYIQQGSNDPVGDAYKHMQSFTKTLATKFAPQNPNANLLFIPPGGQAPPNNPEPPDLNTEQGRRAQAAQVAKMLAAQ